MTSLSAWDAPGAWKGLSRAEGALTWVGIAHVQTIHKHKVALVAELVPDRRCLRGEHTSVSTLSVETEDARFASPVRFVLCGCDRYHVAHLKAMYDV